MKNKIVCKLSADLFVVKDGSQIYIVSEKQTGLENPEIGDSVSIAEWYLNLNKKECENLSKYLGNL